MQHFAGGVGRHRQFGRSVPVVSGLAEVVEDAEEHPLGVDRLAQIVADGGQERDFALLGGIGVEAGASWFVAPGVAGVRRDKADGAAIR